MPNKLNQRWEMLISWDSPKQPFKISKLSFVCTTLYKDAYKESISIIRILRGVGGFDRKEIRLVGLAKAGSFELLQKESTKSVAGLTKYMRKVIQEVKDGPPVNKKKLAKAKLTKVRGGIR